VKYASLAVLGLDLIVLALVALVTVVVGPRFAQVYADMGMALPIITALLLRVSRGGYLAVLILLLMGLVAKEAALQNKKATLIINVAAGAVGILFTMLYVMAVYMPLMPLE
jgi:type II secretory pathway component PulF